MQVESIAEGILQYFWPALSDYQSWKHFGDFFWVVALDRFNCTSFFKAERALIRQWYFNESDTRGQVGLAAHIGGGLCFCGHSLGKNVGLLCGAKPIFKIIEYDVAVGATKAKTNQGNATLKSSESDMQVLNPFMPNVFFQLYQLDESISNFRVV